jgi:hypothetical protein
MNRRVCSITALAVLVFLVGACGGGDGGGPAPTAPAAPGVPLTGTVSAPGGTVAFNPPGTLQRMLAEIFGRPALAALPGLSPVVGVTVELIEIDNNGAAIAPPLATATTNASGTYALSAPAGFTPAARFVVRARGTTNLDAMVTGTTINVDPAADAARSAILSALAATGAGLASVSGSDVLEVQGAVEGLAQEIPAASTTSAAAFSNALGTEASRNEETRFIARNTTAAGGVTGTVTDAAGQPLAGITVVVRDFGEWVTRAVGRTDAQGRYTVTVAPGDYIVGAMNRTGTSTAASEWWTSGGGAAKQLAAEKVVVGAALVTLDFVLAPGGRISGTVTAETTGAALAGITVKVRDSLNSQSVAAVKTENDGTYRISLRPGAYFLEAENSTLQPFASETHNPAINGGLSFGEAARLDVIAGGALGADFSLRAGRMVSGLVSDPATGAVTGVRVRFDDDQNDIEHAVVRRTNNVGEYRVWLRPGIYTIRARGQTATNVDLTTADQTQNFVAAVGEVRMSLQHTGNPVGQAKVHLRDSTGANVSKEGSNSDGTVSMYALTSAANYLLEIRIDDGSFVGSSIYNGRTQLLAGDPVTVTVGNVTNLNALTLPAGGVLSGTVTVAGVPQGNARIQVRSGGTGGGSRFVGTTTQADGTYSISLPAGTYQRVCAFTGPSSSICPGGAVPASGSGYQFVGGLAITAGATTTQDFAIAP